MSNVIKVNFTQEMRRGVQAAIKGASPSYVVNLLITDLKYEESFAKAIVKSVLKREGWGKR